MTPLYKIRKICLLLILIISPLSGFCDAKINQQKALIASLERQLAEGERQISSLRKDKAANETRVRSLASQVETRNRLLKLRRAEEQSIRYKITSLDSSSSALEVKLKVESLHYAEMVRESYRQYSTRNMLAYIFTSKNFQDMAHKIANMRALARMREERMNQIDSLSTKLSLERGELEIERNKLNVVMRDLTNQRTKLQRDINTARANISSMSSKERKILQQKNLSQQKLQAAVVELQKLIKGNKEGASFSGKSSNLNLPVVGGRVKQYMENMAEVVGPEGAKIISIYDGKVVDVKRNRITGKYDIFIAHGEYITSYAGLSTVSVTKDSVVKRNSVIGVIGAAVDIITMKSEYKIVFGIYPPTTKEKMSAANCFKRR